MSPEHMLLLMLVISGSAFFFIALAISSLGTRINLLPSNVRNPSNDVSVNSNGESGVDHQDDGLSGRLSAESSLIGRSVQAVALISGGLLVFAILELGYGVTGLGSQLVFRTILSMILKPAADFPQWAQAVAACFEPWMGYRGATKAVSL